MPTSQNCLFCESDNNLSYLFSSKDFNRNISEVDFNYFECKTCDHIFLKDIPTDLEKYYDNFFNFPTISEFNLTAKKESFKVNMISKHLKIGDKICEIGPSIGIFLFNAKNEGYIGTGLEMSRDCCNFIRNTLKIKAIETDNPSEEIKKISKQNAFTFWHSLEHIPNPKNVLQNCIENLEDNGILVIACPNPDSFGFKLLKKFWTHLDAPRHVNLFSIKNLQKFMQERKMNLVFKTTKDNSAKYYNAFSWQMFFFNKFNKFQVNKFKFKSSQNIFWKLVGKFFSIIFYFLENFNDKGSCYTLIFKKEK